MNDKVSDAILRSVERDEIVHVTIDGDDIYAVLEGVPAEDMIELEHGEWDVWGVDEDAGGEWRLHVYLSGPA